jgi:hypothetical protein
MLPQYGFEIGWFDCPWGPIKTVPTPNSGFVSLAEGEWHSLALKSDGSIEAWGLNYFQDIYTGQCDVPFPNSGFVAVAGGAYHSLAIALEGSLKVTLSPSEAVASGAQWRLANDRPGVWHDSGTSLSLYAERDYTVEYKLLAGWQEPASQIIRIEKDTQTSLTGDYLRIPTCTLTTSATHGYIISSPGRPDYPFGTSVTLFPRAIRVTGSAVGREMFRLDRNGQPVDAYHGYDKDTGGTI